jgi:hypothetical protein
MKELNLDKDDFIQFRTWLNLEIEAITWQGRYKDEFEDFWDSFFIEGLSFEQLVQRFDYAYTESKIGPLSSWFHWLKEKFISYTFINKNLSILELSKKSGLSLSEISSLLRNFFLEFAPHQDEKLSENFQIVHPTNPNVNLTFEGLSNIIRLPEIIHGTGPDEIMPSLEVTLYEEWSAFIRKMKKDIYHPSFDIGAIKSRASFKEQLGIVREVLLLLLIGTVLVYAVKYGNKFYEKYLIEKIGVYEPQFKWLDKALTFKSVQDRKDAKLDFSLNIEDLDEVDDSKAFISDFEEQRYDVESDVVLTSWDSLPKDFSAADLEQSDYEELLKRGYRESRYGHTKVYRVMVKSVNLNSTKRRLNKLLKKYSVTQVDNVKPGQLVPGGVYYNIFVPRLHLKEFMAQVMNQEEANLYESRTRVRRNPPGKNRVFIWVKDI